MSGVNTRDCLELYSKNAIKHIDHHLDNHDEDLDHDDGDDTQNTINVLREMFPLCSLKMIQDTLRRKGYDAAVTYLTEKHDALKELKAKSKKQQNAKNFAVKTDAFPKLSAESDWEVID